MPSPYTPLQLAERVLREAGVGGGATLAQIELELMTPATARREVARLALASYIRPAPAPRLRRARWWEGDPWLAKLANLRGRESAQRERMCAVDALLLGSGGARSSRLRPSRTALFEWVDERLPQPLPSDVDPDADAATVPLRDSRAYRDDTLCLLTLDRAHKLFVVESEQLTNDGLHGRPRDAAGWWEQVVLPFVNARVPAEYTHYEAVPLVQDPQTGQLVPQESLDEPAFALPPPSPPPPGSGSPGARQAAAMQQQESYHVMLPAAMVK